VEKFKPEIEEVNLVLLGSFNPAIFQPAWFGAHEIIRPGEAEDAAIEVIHPEISSFKAGEWLRIKVTQSTFHAESIDGAHHSFIPDLVLKVFGLLEHTPLTAMGINRHMHLRMADIERWHAFGDLLVPKQVWDGLLEGRSGLKSLVVEGGRGKGTLRIKVEPSSRVDYGVYIGTNEHYEASGENATAELMSILSAQWNAAQKHAEKVVAHLLGQSY